ncbi:MAG: hypothetical protein LBV40_02005 [Methanomicrobiales archaeon]|nr:hypothetical protein [Methanomicrobiales archaeon]
MVDSGNTDNIPLQPGIITILLGAIHPGVIHLGVTHPRIIIGSGVSPGNQPGRIIALRSGSILLQLCSIQRQRM